MTDTIKDILNFIKENDVKFIRLAFCDILGVQKNVAIMPNELEYAFENGISFDASAIKGFSDIVHSDLFLFPDPTTLIVLPWRPVPGRVVRFYCDIKNPDNSIFEGDSRNVLKKAEKRCEQLGYTCRIGTECEFYLFKTADNSEPTYITMDKGGYFDISPLDKCENVRREICLHLDEMGLKPESSHHESGPGQNEIDFKFTTALDSADNFLTFKTLVKAVAAGNGLYASFMPKPLKDSSGSGLHLNISLTKKGVNIFDNANSFDYKTAKSFMAGIIERIPEITLFLNPLINSYDRFGGYKAPKYISWSQQNRSQLIRIPAAADEKSRMELRSPDSAINPYLAFALILHAGLDGIEKGAVLDQPIDEDLYNISDNIKNKIKSLPRNLNEALECAEKSEFVSKYIDNTIISKFISIKKSEINEYNNSADKDKFYKNNYFDII